MPKQEYAKHSILKDLKIYFDFYRKFSFPTMFWKTQGLRGINIDTYIYSSIQGTVESMCNVLKHGRIGDAFALLRKYYDSALTNIYISLYLANEYRLNNLIVPEIDEWIKGTTKLPEFLDMIKYIKSSKSVLKPIIDLLDKDDRYKKLRERCNNHLHYNSLEDFMMNDSEVHVENRVLTLNLLQSDVRDIFILHLSCVFHLNPIYMASSDYRDALDCGEEPEENSQYWVAPAVQEIFSNIIAKERPDIAKVILKYTPMHLDEKAAGK